MARPALDAPSVEALAASLFELRAACEADLRALTSMQRSLERARCGGTTNGERLLLLGEIARLLDHADVAAVTIAGLRRQAGERVSTCRECLAPPAPAAAALVREIA